MKLVTMVLVMYTCVHVYVCRFAVADPDRALASPPFLQAKTHKQRLAIVNLQHILYLFYIYAYSCSYSCYMKNTNAPCYAIIIKHIITGSEISHNTVALHCRGLDSMQVKIACS